MKKEKTQLIPQKRKKPSGEYCEQLCMTQALHTCSFLTLCDPVNCSLPGSSVKMDNLEEMDDLIETYIPQVESRRN